MFNNIKLTVFLILGFSLIYGQEIKHLDSLSLKTKTVSLNNIATENYSPNDFSFLDSVLTDVRIVMLGEQSHGDGSTFLAKTNLIKYLHQNLNFDVLIFESGLFDGYRVWEKIKEGDRNLSVFNYGIFPIWTNSKQTELLFKYILEQADESRPLEIAGFDIQPTGSLITPEIRFAELNDYLASKIDFNKEKYPLFSQVFGNIRLAFNPDFGAENKIKMEKEFVEIIKTVRQKDSSPYGKLIVRYIDNYLSTLKLYLNADLRNPPRTPHVFNIRDKGMASNMGFLLNEKYKDKKVIVWGANSHIGYGRGLLEKFENREPSAKAMIPMGQYLKIDYQDKVYSMAFTSAGGSIGSLRGKNMELPKAHNKSLEYYLQENDYNNAFINLRDKELKNEKIITRIYGHSEMYGKWGQMFDGIIFTKTMEPSEMKTKASQKKASAK